MAGKLTKGIIHLLLTCDILGKKYFWYGKGLDYEYTGEMDQDGLACGFGKMSPNWNSLEYEGTFLNDRKHGFCKYFRIK